jgi:heptaprenyl diphosphate synthase
VVRGKEKTVKRGAWENFRKARREWQERRLSSAALFAAGLCAMPALLFNPSLTGRIIQFLLFWALVLLAGKKHNPLATVLVILGIVFFNLLFPYGELFSSFGFLRISSGALEAGLRRAMTLEGLFMLSRLTIRQDLRLPGGFGELIGESFRILALLTERKNTIKAKNIIPGIDGLLLELSAPDAAAEAAVPDKAEKPGPFPGLFVLAALVVLAWLPWLFFRG